MTLPSFLHQAIIKERDAIKVVYEELHKREKALQEACPHDNYTRKANGDSGNWDGHESYWYECYCPDCDKRWTEPQ